MKSLITEPLGLYGWKKLDPIILASLSIEAPMLLIGKHGTAKSFILERISEALKLEYRFYNASLINYDDLVGIPIPSEDKKSLEYITNKTAIWDAEVVFIDEINRTKPELQNKLFPIIYDKRVQGQDLKKLKYRFAAMNPVYFDEEDEEENSYIGAMPLDQALVDRFPFIVEVPTWDDLTEREKKEMLKDRFEGRHEFPVDINLLIKKTKNNFEILKKEKPIILSLYIIDLIRQLSNRYGYISSRRASSMLETLLAVHAARMTLSEWTNEYVDIKDTLYLHIVNTLPVLAYKKIMKLYLLKISQCAWSSCEDKGPLKELYEIKKSDKKIVYIINHKKELKEKDIVDNILNVLQEIDIKKRRAVALIAYFNLRDINTLPASFIETLANEIRPCFEVQHKESLENMKIKQIANKVDILCDGKNMYHDNLLNSFLPDGYDDIEDVESLSNYYKNMMKEVENGR